MPDPVMPKETLVMTMGEEKTFGIDFQDEGAVIDGQTLTLPDFRVSGSGAQVLTAAVTTAIFNDSGKGKKKIPIGKGVAVKLRPLLVGTFDVACKVTTNPGGEKLEILGKLTITATLP